MLNFFIAAKVQKLNPNTLLIRLTCIFVVLILKFFTLRYTLSNIYDKKHTYWSFLIK